MKNGSSLTRKHLSSYDNAAIFPTFRCTLSCPDCSAKCARNAREPDMTREEIRHFYDRLHEQGVRLKHIRFSGGEPTLWSHLSIAMLWAKTSGLADKVIVFSNGLNKQGYDYEYADLVRITHYGALNRRSIWQLKKDLGKRLRVSWTVHIPFEPNTELSGTLPAECGSRGLCFARNKVYPCCYRALKDIDGFSVDDNFYALCCNSRANEQEICKHCWSNPSLFKQVAVPLTLEAGIWESPYGFFLRLPWRMIWLRRLMANRYVRRAFGRSK